MIEADYRQQGEPRALYYAPYRKKYGEITPRVQQNGIVPSDIDISFIGNRTILSTHFDLRKSDRTLHSTDWLYQENQDTSHLPPVRILQHAQC